MTAPLARIVSARNQPEIAYFVHDLNDAAVARRVSMFEAGGARIRVAGFRRRAIPQHVAGASATDLGLTADAKLGQRALSVLRVAAMPRVPREFARDADVLVARNLESLIIAARVRRPHQRLVYECLDIHRKMVGSGVAGALLRMIERRLLGGTDLLLTSSPAFLSNHFDRPGHYRGPRLIVENKPLLLDGGSPDSPGPAAGPPWRIGWFGMLRCPKSLALLSEMVRASQGAIEVLVAGRPSYSEFEDFDRDVAATPGLSYIGPYTADDLPSLYARCHFVWCVDYFEEGLNSSWLLPNRLYEGLAHGAVPIATQGVEIARWLEAAGVGIVCEDLARDVPAALAGMTAERFALLRKAVSDLPKNRVIADRTDCERLVTAVTGEPDSAPPADASDVLLVIPCLNEEEHLPHLLAKLVEEVPGALIVVADGGSTDNSRAIVETMAAEHPNLRLLANPARIQGAGINLAARRFGRGRSWLVRIDAHCTYPRGYVSGLLAAAKASGADAVTVPMITRGESCFQAACAAAQNSILGTGGSRHRHVGEGCFVDHGHHALIRLAPFLAAGGYCESFTANEDAELDHRLGLAGARIWLEPKLAIIYYPRKAPMPLLRQYLRYGEGRARTVQRHRMKMKARQLAPLAVAPAVLALALAPALGWWIALPALLWAGLCLAFGLLLGLRTRSKCAALSGAAAMIMHFAWSFGFWRQVLFGKRPGPSPAALAID
jgi:succinoglycan biosynthesis protein ExoL